MILGWAAFIAILCSTWAARWMPLQSLCFLASLVARQWAWNFGSSSSIIPPETKCGAGISMREKSIPLRWMALVDLLAGLIPTHFGSRFFNLPKIPVSYNFKLTFGVNSVTFGIILRVNIWCFQQRISTDTGNLL